jgi:hypothetical protein
MAYTYLASAFIGIAITRFKHRGGRLSADEAPPKPAARDSVAG